MIPSRGLRALTPVLALAALGMATAASADPSDDYINPDRPGIADGSTTVGNGHFQIETAIQTELRHDGDEHERTMFFPTLLRYGFADKVEVRVEGNTYSWTRQKDSTGISHSDGFAPTSIGLKYNFADAPEGSKQVSLGAIARVFPPSGSGEFRNSKTTGDFRLAADWAFADKWSLNPNIGVGVFQDDSNRTYTAGLFAATLNFNPSKTLNFFADTGIQAPEEKGGKTSVIIDAGVAYIIGHDIQLDLSAGTGVAGSAPPHPFLAAGFSKRF
jgi:hypothetical protein